MAHRIRRLRALQRAVEWQLQLENGEVRSRKEIAEREGMSQPAVTQAMRVLGVFENGRGDLLPMHVFRTRRNTAPSAVRPFRERRKELLERFETDYVTATLGATGGNLSKAARLARIDRKHFWRLVQRTGFGETRLAKQTVGRSGPAKGRTGGANANDARQVTPITTGLTGGRRGAIQQQKETVLRAAALLPPGFRKADVMRQSRSAVNLSRALAWLVEEGKLRREGDRNRARYWLAPPRGVRFPEL
jgi:hypothetical protein